MFLGRKAGYIYKACANGRQPVASIKFFRNGVSLQSSIKYSTESDKPKPLNDSTTTTTQSSKTDNHKGSSKAKTVRAKTPIGKLDELEEGQHPYQEKEPLPPWPDNTNPHTGEIGGPRGPEPTRYGDWERKGRVSDF